MKLEILHLDEHLVAVFKPSGLLVHRSAISNDRIFALQIVRDQLGQRVYPVHRLDRPTSGVLVFGLTQEVASALSESFRERRVTKCYQAVVRGFAPETKRIERPLRDERDKEPLDSITTIHTQAKVRLPIAVGGFPEARYSLVAAFPETGRRHQIRRHLAGESLPIVGDTRYGRGEHNRLFRDRFQSDRLLLAARWIRFPHPATGDPLRIEAPLGPDLTNLFTELGWLDIAEPCPRSVL
ncbi:tRNA pseudouridine(65) synthase TruC [Sulfidibacter corallicola]|uniref:tRNA pseudouridine synthase C n=1 Tax=Sulfidibacter corallicola TaxID=2818388 RepID=A0A8A4TPB8_SULCO|nr:pseudouridine synthase [Sulfidibacter corallicola]QTD51277.1 tRNA pseudouridine(65) synthase TruC [Sulfidibacter corallicola]